MSKTAELFNQIGIENLITELNPKNHNDYFKITCPQCGEREAYIYPGGNYDIKCSRQNKCQYEISLFEYIQERERHRGNKETMSYLNKLAGNDDNYNPPKKEVIKKDDPKKVEIKLPEFKNELEPDVIKYLKGRGVDPDNVNVKRLIKNNNPSDYRYKKGRKLVIQDDKNCCFRSILKNPDKKVSFEGDKGSLLNLSNINLNNKDVVIVEGDIDLLITLSHVKENNITGLPATTYKLNMWDKQKLKGKRIFLLMDNDLAGEKAKDYLVRDLEKNKCEIYICSYSEGINDLGEYAKKYGFNKTREYLQKLIVESGHTDKLNPIKTYNEIRTTKNNERLMTTGIKTFDDFLNGGMRYGLYGLAARPGAGKTRFLLSLAVELASRNITTIFYSLEESKEKLFDRLLSWFTGISENHITDRWVSADLKERIKQTNIDYECIYKNIYIIDKYRNVEDIEADIRRRMSDDKTVIMIDYLQQIGLKKNINIREKNSEIIWFLKDVAKILQIPIWLISSSARYHYAKSNKEDKPNPLTAFKESGDIEYTLNQGFVLENREKEIDGELVRSDGMAPFENLLSLIMAKNRFGSCFELDGNFREFKFKFNFRRGIIITDEKYGLVEMNNNYYKGIDYKRAKIQCKA